MDLKMILVFILAPILLHLEMKFTMGLATRIEASSRAMPY